MIYPSECKTFYCFEMRLLSPFNILLRALPQRFQFISQLRLLIKNIDLLHNFRFRCKTKGSGSKKPGLVFEIQASEIFATFDIMR